VGRVVESAVGVAAPSLPAAVVAVPAVAAAVAAGVGVAAAATVLLMVRVVRPLWPPQVKVTSKVLPGRAAGLTVVRALWVCPGVPRLIRSKTPDSANASAPVQPVAVRVTVPPGWTVCGERLKAKESLSWAGAAAVRAMPVSAVTARVVRAVRGAPRPG
jgi:hypothetical protein